MDQAMIDTLRRRQEECNRRVDAEYQVRRQAQVQQAHESRHVREVVELMLDHARTWRDQPESYWFARLVAEVGELGGALVGDHDDAPEWELTQIAAICLNWLDMRGAAAS